MAYQLEMIEWEDKHGHKMIEICGICDLRLHTELQTTVLAYYTLRLTVKPLQDHNTSLIKHMHMIVANLWLRR